MNNEKHIKAAYMNELIQKVEALRESAKALQEAIGPLTQDTEYWLCELFFMTAGVRNNFEQRIQIMKNVHVTD